MPKGATPPPARLLDITRLTSRISRVFTGVDRVELAYLRAVANDPVPAFAIARTALGYVLLDAAGIAAFLTKIETEDWPTPDFASRVNHRLDQSAKIGQTLVRRLSVKRCLRNRLQSMLDATLPGGFAYLNVGHSNLTDRTLATFDAMPNVQTSVLIHDTIPLDYPQFQRPGTAETFAAKLRRVSVYADLVICISEASKQAVAAQLDTFGRVPTMIAAHLGVPTPDVGVLPKDIVPDRPYFVTVGTIEPRKNHALLLDVWSRLGADAPQLFVCGTRGWNNADVFAALDAQPANIVERAGLRDDALAALISGSQAMLFPSFAEGFGLPPIEAAALGAPVICADLPVLRETLGNNAIYLDPTDVYQWENTIKGLAGADRSQVNTEYAAPTWEAHFKIVFTMT